MSATAEEIKRRFGAEELRSMFDREGLVVRGSGRQRARCPGCQDSPREVSVREVDGVGVWKCHHCGAAGSAIDLVMAVRGADVATAIRELEQIAGTSSAPTPTKRRPSLPEARPPAREVADVWARSKPVSDLPDVCEAWRARGLDVTRIEDFDLARAMPFGMTLPAWARFDGRAWSEGPYRLIVPMFDAAGRLVSLHARAAKGATPKGLSPAGFAIAGTVMASPLARLMLEGNGADDVRRVGLLIAEGVPDFLAWGTRWSDANESAPAVVSVISGSWTAEIGARIPTGTRVAIGTHEDDAGDKYAATIATDDLSRRCSLSRLRLQEAA